MEALGPYQAELGWTLIDAGTAPENFTGTVRKSKPEVIVIADCGEIGLEPGSVRIGTVDELAQGGFSTHTPSLSLVTGIWEAELGATTYVLAMQPGQIRFGEGLSPAVQEGLAALVETIGQSAGGHSGNG